MQPSLNMPVWTLSPDIYQSLKGVHQPWICEIAPSQYASMSQRQKNAYDKKRALEWDASAKCKTEFRKAVIKAFDEGLFQLDSPDVHEEVKRFMGYVLDEREKAKEALKLQALHEANQVQSIDVLKPGNRVFFLIYGRYGTITKVNRKSVRVSFPERGKEAGYEATLDPRLLTWQDSREIIKEA